MPYKLSREKLAEVFPQLNEIGDRTVADAVTRVWQAVCDEMPWNDIDEIPKNALAESGRSLVGHVHGMTQMALALAKSAERTLGTPYDKDLLIASCLLHDVSKAVEIEPDGEEPGFDGEMRKGRKSKLGAKIPHGVYGAHKALVEGLSLEVANLIITHTHKSNVRGDTWEAALLFYADYAETDAYLASRGSRMFLQRWKMD